MRHFIIPLTQRHRPLDFCKIDSRTGRSTVKQRILSAPIMGHIFFRSTRRNNVLTLNAIMSTCSGRIQTTRQSAGRMPMKVSAFASRTILSLVTRQSTRRRLSLWRRKTEWLWDRLNCASSDFFEFRCNVCGKNTSFLRAKLSREYRSCVYCGSSVRQRSIIYALSTELFGMSLDLSDFPMRKDLVGVGLSDWDGFSVGLAQKFSYTNTYFHQEPFLDITSVNPSQYGQYDFIVASDVFEHISPPVSKAFENARRLLKPNGVMIFTVPYVAGESTEHFPELNQLSLEKRKNNWVLVNSTPDGKVQEFTDLIFHGGPGTVLEMRVFGKDSLMRHARDADFGSVHIYDAEFPENGVVWLTCTAENSQYCFPIRGSDTPPWAFRNSK